MEGKFIVIEGIHGSGKSTQASLLSKQLEERGEAVTQVESATDGRIGKMIRKFYVNKNPEINSPMIDLFLHLADLQEALREKIMPDLQKGRHVISVRYTYSNLAYRRVQGLDLNWLLKLIKPFPTPDLTIIIDAPPKTCLRRIKDREGPKTKFENLEFLKKLRDVYLELPQILSDERLIIVDGDREVEKVQRDITEKVQEILT